MFLIFCAASRRALLSASFKTFTKAVFSIPLILIDLTFCVPLTVTLLRLFLIQLILRLYLFGRLYV